MTFDNINEENISKNGDVEHVILLRKTTDGRGQAAQEIEFVDKHGIQETHMAVQLIVQLSVKQKPQIKLLLELNKSKDY